MVVTVEENRISITFHQRLSYKTALLFQLYLTELTTAEKSDSPHVASYIHPAFRLLPVKVI